MQFTRFDNFGQLAAQAHKLVINRATVCLDLGFAWSPNETKTAPLTFEVRPRANKPRSLIAQRRHLNLQNTLSRARTIGENLKNKPRAVKNLDAPLFLEIALLNGAYGPIDQNKLNLACLKPFFDFVKLTLAKQHPCVWLL